MASKPLLILASRFNSMISKALVSGALDTLRDEQVPSESIKILWTPGCFELPGLAAQAARSGQFSAIICLGAVIKGDTPHFDYVAQETARGIQNVSMEYGLPVIFGILTTNSEEEALSRCGLKGGHKGSDAALTALSMVKTYQELHKLVTHA